MLGIRQIGTVTVAAGLLLALPANLPCGMHTVELPARLWVSPHKDVRTIIARAGEGLPTAIGLTKDSRLLSYNEDILPVGTPGVPHPYGYNQ